MSGKELYEKYAGRKATFMTSEGIICGYDDINSNSDMCLLMAVPSARPYTVYTKWMSIITHKEGHDYFWVSEENIID